MSRSRHQKHIKTGVDFGSRYNCNKNYIGGTGKAAKKAAHKEMRAIKKPLEQNEQVEV